MSAIKFRILYLKQLGVTVNRLSWKVQQIEQEKDIRHRPLVFPVLRIRIWLMKQLTKKLTVTKLVNKFTEFYGTWMFILVHPKTSRCKVTRASLIQSTHSHRFYYYILTLSSRLHKFPQPAVPSLQVYQLQFCPNLSVHIYLQYTGFIKSIAVM